MKYYKDNLNKVFAFDDDEIPCNWIDIDLTEISEYEANELTKPSKDEVISLAEFQKQSLLHEASVIINPLNYAYDMKIATDNELVKLNAWKKYSILINRVDTSTAPDITWPSKPQLE